jgi:signal transduction histidine kinase
MDSSQDIARAVAAIRRIDAVPTLLKVLCEMTGLRFAAVARVSGMTWTACAVRDELPLGVKPGGQLAFMASVGVDSQTARVPIVIDQARMLHTPRGAALGSNGLTTVIQELQVAQPDCKILSTIDVSRSVRCDLGRLQQVASNLLGNALTHGLAGSPVKFSAGTDEHDLVLEVWNSGEPIAPESLVKIFEPFWRHSASASRNGLGLGLHICSQIVRAHQGKIAVTSTAEHGTRFTVRLPLTEVLLSTATFPDAAPEPVFHPSIAAVRSSSESISASS